jgi:thymidylate kinase
VSADTPASRPLADPALTLRADTPGPGSESGGTLLQLLVKALEAQDVAYCQWKGHWSAHRWAIGEGDIDLLVDHSAIARFRTLVTQLGFKLTLPPGARQMAGVESYFGHDPAVPRPLHLHVHYRLVLGDYWKTTYRIPIERPVLETAVPGETFRVPSPTYQFLIFVLRMALRQRGRPLRYARRRWLRGIQRQLDYLEEISDRKSLAAAINQHLPTITLGLFDRCVASLRGHGGPIRRAALVWQLHRRLRAHARRPSLAAVLSAGVEQALPPGLVGLMFEGRMRVAGGGTVVALIGGDGAGKSTCAYELGTWLSEDLAMMRAHLGNPPRSGLTLAVGGALKLQQAFDRWFRHDRSTVSLIELLRHLCTARDCHRLYEKVRRFAARGGIAICERYPVPENRLLVGPRIPELLSPNPSAVASYLRNAEVSYYARILPPDCLIVLRLDPELAVRRKPEEPADYVRTRGRVVWDTDWSATEARVVDAGRTLPEVLRQLKSIIWSVL